MATTAVTTGIEFDRLPYEEGRRWELVEGELIPVPSPTLEHQEIVFRVLTVLRNRLGNTGAIVSHDVEFALGEDIRLRPDVWVVLAPRAEGIDARRVPIPGGPDLAVEIISPSEYASEAMRKVSTYLYNGVTEVWQVYPKTREVVVHGAPGAVKKFRGDENLAGWLLPDLEIPVSQLFL